MLLSKIIIQTFKSQSKGDAWCEENSCTDFDKTNTILELLERTQSARNIFQIHQYGNAP